MDTMKAVRAHRRGGPEQLVFEVAPRPEPAPGEALVAVHAASITPDELTWDATWTDRPGPGGRDRTPIIPSHEMSGVVTSLGAGVTDVAVGDEVYALIPFVRDGAAAEYVSLPADVLAAKPVSIDHDAAAAVPLAALTAWQALVDHARLRASQHVLIHGAAGGVGSFAVQIAAHLGARVTATARKSDRDFVQGLGAADVLDYENDRFEDRVTDVDVVLDLVGGQTQARSWQVLRPGGVLVSIVAPPDPEEAAQHRARGVFFIVEPDRPSSRRSRARRHRPSSRPSWTAWCRSPTRGRPYEGLATEHRQGKVVLHIADEQPDLVPLVARRTPPWIAPARRMRRAQPVGLGSEAFPVVPPTGIEPALPPWAERGVPARRMRRAQSVGLGSEHFRWYPRPDSNRRYRDG